METYRFREFYIPDRMMGGLQRYLEHGIAPGDFLSAILSNDLYKACSHADTENIQNLPAYVGYLYNEVPQSAWGSPEVVKEWMDTFTPKQEIVE